MSSDELPVNDYDELSVPNLRHRIRTLDQAQLLNVLNYECAHAARVPVLEVLEARLRELERGAEPSGGNAITCP